MAHDNILKVIVKGFFHQNVPDEIEVVLCLRIGNDATLGERLFHGQDFTPRTLGPFAGSVYDGASLLVAIGLNQVP